MKETRLETKNSYIRLRGKSVDVNLLIKFIKQEKYGLPRNLVKSIDNGMLSLLFEPVHYWRKYKANGFIFECVLMPSKENFKTIYELNMVELEDGNFS